MTTKEGKALLQKCLDQSQSGIDVDELFLYQIGNRKRAEEYQKDIILAEVVFSKLAPSVKYIVKCFIHMEIYAAWSTEEWHRENKCIVYKNSLIKMETEKSNIYEEFLVDEKAKNKVFLFRGETGIMHFLKIHKPI